MPIRLNFRKSKSGLRCSGAAVSDGLPNIAEAAIISISNPATALLREDSGNRSRRI